MNPKVSLIFQQTALLVLSPIWMTAVIHRQARFQNIQILLILLLNTLFVFNSRSLSYNLATVSFTVYLLITVQINAFTDNLWPCSIQSIVQFDTSSRKDAEYPLDTTSSIITTRTLHQIHCLHLPLSGARAPHRPATQKRDKASEWMHKWSNPVDKSADIEALCTSFFCLQKVEGKYLLPEKRRGSTVHLKPRLPTERVFLLVL